MWETCIYRNKFIVEWFLGELDSKINQTIWNNFYKALLNTVQNWKFIKVILKITVGFDKFDYGDMIAAIKRCERINSIAIQSYPFCEPDGNLYTKDFEFLNSYNKTGNKICTAKHCNFSINNNIIKRIN